MEVIENPLRFPYGDQTLILMLKDSLFMSIHRLKRYECAILDTNVEKRARGQIYFSSFGTNSITLIQKVDKRVLALRTFCKNAKMSAMCTTEDLSQNYYKV